ncbi:RCC1 domain-containing protein [Streptomyces sp. NPDC004788]
MGSGVGPGVGRGAAPAARAATRAAEPGTAYAWGSDAAGRLGRGVGSGLSTTPVTVCGDVGCSGALDEVAAVEAGSGHAVALRGDGTVWTWGSNTYGQLGDGTTAQRNTPVRVPGLTDVTAVAAGGAHTLALKRDGTVWAWGRNNKGQLGDETTTDRSTPVQVHCVVYPEQGCGEPVLARGIAIAAGGEHSLALGTNGDVSAWGSNASGQLGDGSGSEFSSYPVPSFVPNAKAIAAGGAHSLAVAADDGTAYAWGSNSDGQLGDGTTTDATWPQKVCATGTSAGCTTFLTGVTGVDAGALHTLAIVAGGVRSWGANASGQLGDGTTTTRTTPVKVCSSGTTAGCTTFLGNVTAVSAGGAFSLTRQSEGTARSWGANASGQLGTGTQTGRLTPGQICASGQAAPCGRYVDGVGAIAAGADFGLTTLLPRADVRVAISADEPVASGEDLTYTITVRNDGPAAADGVMVDSALPAGSRFVSASPSRGSCTGPPVGSSGTVTCPLGRIGASGQATVSIRVGVTAATGSMITDTVTVSSATPDPRQVNNSATLRTPVG